MELVTAFVLGGASGALIAAAASGRQIRMTVGLRGFRLEIVDRSNSDSGPPISDGD